MKQFDLYAAENPEDVCASPRMIKTLKKCYQMELTFPGKPYGPKDFKESFSGLYKRGLLDIDMSNKSLKTGRWYITTKGFQLLISVSTKRIAVNDPLFLSNISKLKQNIELLQNSLYNLQVTSAKKVKSIAW